MAQRFVILAHTVNGQTHYDLMLDVEGQAKLRTIQLTAWPLEVGEASAAKQIGDHRRAYLDYEGEVSGGRGIVARVAEGTWLDQADVIALSTGVRLQVQGAEIRRIE